MNYRKPFSSRDSEQPLGQYRLYFRGPFNPPTSPPFEFEADDDAAALRIAASLREGREMELWCGPRMLKRWPRGD